jgi:hypothetical protein
MALNVELMEKVRDKIRENPDRHDQNSWAVRMPCGTTYCIAGWTAVLSGATIDWDSDEEHAYADTVNNGAEAICEYAQDQLGLESYRLFFLNDRQALEELDRLIEDGRRERSAEPQA